MESILYRFVLSFTPESRYPFCYLEEEHVPSSYHCSCDKTGLVLLDIGGLFLTRYWTFVFCKMRGFYRIASGPLASQKLLRSVALNIFHVLYVLLTLHPRTVWQVNPTRCTVLFNTFICFPSPHVSGIHVPIIRRKSLYLCDTAIYHFGWMAFGMLVGVNPTNSNSHK